MSEIQNNLNTYYEEASIASVEEVEAGNGCYDYERMFSSFCCPNKDSCREACRAEYRPSDEDPRFLFSPRTECIEVSQCYAEREYEGHCIPRIVVISLSIPKPELMPPCPAEENRSCPLNPHWRGTTTTVRSLLCPSICLAPAGDDKDESTKIIEKFFVHIRTGKCFSNAGGKNQEPYQLYENCGCYLKKEVSILKPDVIVTQGNPAHDMSEKYVFDVIERREVEGIANSDSIAHIVRLREDNREVYWLRSRFPTWRAGFYSPNHAGPAIDSESDGVENRGKKRRNLVLYGKDIKRFMDMEGR